jgi:signal peptide peptidase SppA
MKNFSHIANKLYQDKWCILPMVHQSLVKQFENHIKGGMPMPDDMPENMPQEPMDEETTVGNVAVINVEGIIGKHLSIMETMCGACDLDCVTEDLKAAAADDNIKNIVLYFNSPGGTVTGVRELGDLIQSINKNKKCFAYTDTLCASAAYWLASQCEYVYTSPSAEIGSVGVYTLIMDQSRQLDKAGITVNAISAGKYKLSGASFRPMSDEERAMFQTDVNKTYEQFKSTVNNNRKISDEYLQGQVFDGETAVVNGLSDGNINSLGELVTLINETIGQTNK